MADPSNLCDTFSWLALTKYDAINDIYRRAVGALKDYVDHINWSQMSQKDANQVHAYCDQMHQSIRQAMLIMLYSYLETDLNLMGNHFFPDYKSKVDAEKKGDGTVKAQLRGK